MRTCVSSEGEDGVEEDVVFDVPCPRAGRIVDERGRLREVGEEIVIQRRTPSMSLASSLVPC